MDSDPLMCFLGVWINVTQPHWDVAVTRGRIELERLKMQSVKLCMPCSAYSVT